MSARGGGRAGLGRWGALGILMVLAFLNYMDRNLIYPLLPLIARSLGITVEALGALATGFHVVYALTAPLMGAVSDRVARKTVLLVSLVLWSIITALSGTATGFLSLLIWRSLTGFGEGGYFPTAVSLIGDLFGPTERGLAIALHGICTSLGGSAGYALGGTLGEAYGWRVPFFLVLAPGLVLAFVLYLFFVEPPRGSTKKPEGAAAAATDAAADAAAATVAMRPYVAIVTYAPVLLMSLAACFGAFAMTGINTFLPTYLVDVRSVSLSKAGVLTGAFFAATIVGQLSGGVISDRVASRRPGARPLFVAIPYLISAPALLWIPHAEALSFVLVSYGAAQLLRGFGEPNIYGTIIDSTPSHERGTAQGFLLMLTFVGSSASGWGGGRLITRWGFTAAIHSFALTALLAGVLASVLAARVFRASAAQARVPT